MPPYPSPVLFHGPSARTTALSACRGLGRLLREFGDDGLKIAESREILEVMGNAPVGDQPGVVLMGPMDLALQGATDVLLKSIEEFDPDLVRPVLWAHDETEVSSTIRSRCLRRWCPGQVLNDEDSMMRARELVDEALEGHRASVVELLKDQDPRLTLESVAAVLGERVLEGATRPLWDQVREALSVPHPTPTEALAALLFEEGRP